MGRLVQGKLDEHSIEISVVRADKVFHIMSPSEIESYLSELL